MIENEDYPYGNYTEVCTTVASLMCIECPHFDYPCMPMRHGINTFNHDQICKCMQHFYDRLAGKYPTRDEIPPDPDGEATGCCQDVGGMLVKIVCDGCQQFNECMPDAYKGFDYLNYRELSVCLDNLNRKRKAKLGYLE